MTLEKTTLSIYSPGDNSPDSAFRETFTCTVCPAASVPTAGDTEIGYWIGEPHWGAGYATEAAQAILDLAFSRHRVDEVWAACRMTNEASRRVLVKCGFQWSGTGLRRSRALGGMVSIERYRLDRKAWASLRAWGHGRGR